jgi:hypothetical protein
VPERRRRRQRYGRETVSDRYRADLFRQSKSAIQLNRAKLLWSEKEGAALFFRAVFYLVFYGREMLYSYGSNIN